jgi:ComF family protein
MIAGAPPAKRGSSGARDHRTVLGRLVSRSLDIAFPATCAGCGREGDPICPACRPVLDARLALPPGVPIGIPAELPPGLLQVEWCAPFGGVVRTALHQLKYAGERRLSGPLGQAIARRWAAVGAGGDILVPVPVHAERAAQRGYDQAVLLAETAATALGVPAATVLARRRATVAQYHLDRADRAANVAGAFALASPAASAAVRDRWVVLVDDVMTTGATLSACAAALAEAGALGVSSVTVARER